MTTRTGTKIADQVWIGLALLLRENPDVEGFSVARIKERVRREFGGVAPGIEPHIRQHCLAEKEPKPGRYRMLVKAGKDTYRLFRDGDAYHPDREGAKTRPNPEDIPEEDRPLLTWYEEEYAPAVKLFGPEALVRLLSIPPVRTEETDVSANKHKYIAQAIWDEFHEKPSKQAE